MSAAAAPASAGFLFGQLGDLGDKLLSVMTFHIIPSAVTPDKLSGPEGEPPACSDGSGWLGQPT